MKTKSFVTALAVSAMILGMGASVAAAIEKIPPDPKAVKLVNDFMAALAIPDDASRIKAILPLVHKSLLTQGGLDLKPTIKDYSYRRAVRSYSAYALPLNITVVHKGTVTTVGFADTAEKGRTDKYFCPKREGVAGMPAPVHVFWPEAGGDPKIIDFGSL